MNTDTFNLMLVEDAWDAANLELFASLQGSQGLDASTDGLSYLLQEEKSIDNATQTLINFIMDNPSHQNICIREDNENKKLSICFKDPYKIHSAAFMGALVNVLLVHDMDKIEFICCRFEKEAWDAFFNKVSAELKSVRLSFVDCSIGEEQLVILNNLKDKIIELTLENQIFNSSQIEKLSIFLENNSTIKELYLRGNQLENYAFLGDPLKGCISLEILDLAGNELNDDAASVLATAVSSLLKLKHVLLHKNRISDFGIHAITDKLKDRSPDIRLTVEQNSFSEEAKGIKRKREASQKTDLEQDTLSENSIPNKKERKDIQIGNDDVSLVLEQALYGEEKYGELIKDLQSPSYPKEELLNRILLVKEAEKQEKFFEILLSKEFDIVPISGDGDCLFASIATGLERSNPFIRFIILEYAKRYQEAFKDYDFKTLPLHHCLRQMAVHYISTHQHEFGAFISDEEFPQSEGEILDVNRKVVLYVNKMKQSGTWGGDCEIKALLNIFKKMRFKRSIKIFDINNNPTFESGELQTPEMLYRTTSKRDLECIYLLRKHQNHYLLMIK